MALTRAMWDIKCALDLELYAAKLEYAVNEPTRANWPQLLIEAEQLGEAGVRLYKAYFDAADKP